MLGAMGTHDYFVAWDDGKYGRERSFATLEAARAFVRATFDEPSWRAFAAPRLYQRVPLEDPHG